MFHPFWYFAAGVMVGCFIGTFALALCIAAKKQEREGF